jgi:uncharacterized protein
VVMLGTASLVERDRKLDALRVISDHILPGRWDSLRPVKPTELDDTAVLAMEIVEASAKVRVGPPHDDEEDYALSMWAGLLNFPVVTPHVVPDPRLPRGIPVPAHVERYARPRRQLKVDEAGDGQA